MARLNIEDSIFKDPRFIDYCIKKSCKATALGELIFMWIVAQKHFLKDGEIPNSEWIKNNLDEDIVNFGLAQRSSTGVRACGQNEQFAWLKQARDAGRSSAKKRNNAQPKKSRTTVNKLSNDRTTELNGSCTSYSLLSSLTLNSNSNSNKGATLVQNEFCHEAIAYFCLSWKNKYNASYKFLPKEIGLLKGQFKGTSLEAFKELVDAYFKMHKARFVEKRHNFTEFYYSISEINHFMQTGVRVSNHDAKQIELQEHNKNVFSKLATRGEK